MSADALTWAVYVTEHWRPTSNGFLDAPWGFVSAYLEGRARRAGSAGSESTPSPSPTRLFSPPREGGRPAPGRLTTHITQPLAVLTALRSITHVIGFQPRFHRLGQSDEDEAVLWAQCLLEAGPALSHIGIIVQNTSSVPAFERVTKAITRVLLSSRRVRSLCFRYLGSHATHRTKDELERLCPTRRRSAPQVSCGRAIAAAWPR